MQAPGAPGSPPTWTSSAKDLVGGSLGPSRLWFTTGYGIVNEVYYPRIDQPQIRDLGFIVADDRGFWVEVKRLGAYRTRLPQPGGRWWRGSAAAATPTSSPPCPGPARRAASAATTPWGTCAERLPPPRIPERRET